MCPRSKLKRGSGTMSEDFARKVIDDAYKLGARMVKLQWFGETLTVLHWGRIARYAKRKGMKTILFTNGSLLNGKNRKYVLKYIDKLFVSVDSSQKKVYEEIRVGLKFSKLVANLGDLMDERRESQSKVRIILSQVKIGVNDDDSLEPFVDLCDTIVFNYDNVNVKSGGKVKVICSHNVGERLVVGFDGKCYLCCHDWLGEYEIGDLKKETMRQVVNGQKKKDYLKTLDDLDICQKCMSAKK